MGSEFEIVRVSWSVSASQIRLIMRTTEDNHTALGKTLLPQTLTSLLKAALGGASIPDETRTSAVFEVLRVSANLCMDHGKSAVFISTEVLS
jgi:hypothetical protein